MHKIMKTCKSCIVLTSSLVLLSCVLRCCAMAIQTEEQAMRYLSKSGYLSLSMENKSLENNMPKNTMTPASMKFQTFVGLRPTAHSDDETLHYTNKPICGFQDKVGFATGSRSRRYLKVGKWEKNNLTYNISKYSERLGKWETESEIQKAFKVWSDVTPLTFTQKQSGQVDIDIRFEKGEHGDNNTFDGPDGILAHATFPNVTNFVHFDDAELWSIGLAEGTNFLQVAAHEFGHSLGLVHTYIPSTLMAADYYSEDFNISSPLGSDDIKRIQVEHQNNIT